LKQSNENSTIKLKKRSIFHKIVNGFIGFFIGFFLLILLILGFTQTSLFRGILREQVIKIANSSLNGTINIGRIDGTIFTSLILNDVTVNMKQDTLLKARLIEVRTSPLQIFYKKIFVRKVGIEDAKISFLKDTAGNLNVSKLFKPTEEDTSKSSFPFKIKLVELKLSDIDFSMQNEDKKNSVATYDNMTMDDFRVRGLNLQLSANADIDNNDFELFINNLSLASNINNFNIEQLKGDFLVNTKRIIVGALELKTKRSEINLSVKNEGLNIFGDFTKDSINNSKTDLLLDIKKFAFDDMSAIIPSLNYLKGDIQASLKASGNIKQVDFQRLEVKYLDTKLNCSGYMRDLDAGSKMFISALFTKSNVVESNIPKLIAGLSLPVYKNMDNFEIDSLKFEGEPLNFQSRLAAVVNKGIVKADMKIDLRPEDMVYNVNLFTKELNLEPVINTSTKLNLDVKISGSGTSPKKMSADVEIKADGSSFRNINIDAFKLKANAAGQFVNLNMNALAGGAKLGIDGGIDLIDTENPVYNFNMSAEKLDFAVLFKDTTLASNLNFKLETKGKSFDPDKLYNTLKLSFTESSLMGYNLDDTEINLAVEDIANDERSIKISSEFGSISFTGRYSIKDIAGVAANDILLIKDQVFNKLHQSFPSLKLASAQPDEGTQTYSAHDSMYVNFKIEMKDFSMFSKIFNAAQLDVDGKIDGRYETSSNGMNFILSTDINYFQYWNNKDVLFITGMKGSIKANDNFTTNTIADLSAAVDLSVERVFTGNDLANIDLSADLKNNILTMSAGGEFETKFKGKLKGQADISGLSVKLELDSLKFLYNKLKINNDGKIQVDILDNRYDIRKLSLAAGESRFNASGVVDLQGEQNLKLNLNDLSLKYVMAGISETENNNQVDAGISMSADLTGTFAQPVFAGIMNINNLSFKDKGFGNLGCTTSYKDKNLLFDVKIIDTVSKSDSPKFLLKGNLPIDLAFTGAEKRLLEDEALKIKIIFDEFNLASLGNSIPKISEIQGKVNADLNFEGTLTNLKKSGYLNVTDCSFFSDANYLPYNAGLKISLAEDILSIDQMFLENKSGVKTKGRINATGNAIFDGYKINTAEIKMKGDLTVLTEESKNALSLIYGELYMATDGDAVFTYNKGKMFVSAPIEIKKADLVFPPLTSGFRSYNEKYIYKYPVYTDTMKIGKKTGIEKVKEAITQAAASKTPTTISSGNTLFDYDISIKIKDDAKIVFIVNKETNLKLVAELSGNFKYENYGGVLNTFGELKLLEGSVLEFIKTLDATGSMRFESDISNPYLNVVATYKNYFKQDQASGGSSQEDEVTVRIKIASYLQDLSKNLQSEDNVSIFMSAENLKNNTPDKSKGIVDAAMFFLTGNFPTQKGESGRLESSIAGSVLGGVLNSYLGDAVKRVDIRTVGNETKFNLSGKYGNFKYTIGGDTGMLQDLSRANVKVEHPLIENFLLRLERKQTVIDNYSSGTEQMFYEMGLKYRYEF